MADFTLKRGDTAPSLQAILRDKDGQPVDLTSSSVQFVMRAVGAVTNSAPAVSAGMTVATDQATNAGQVTYDWQVGDTSTAGAYVAEFVVTWPSGREQTFPTVGFVSIQINDDLESHLVSLARAAAVETSLAAPSLERGLVVGSDAEAKAAIARKTAAATAPVLSDADLDELVRLAVRPQGGGYNLDRAAAEGWRWKAARAAGGFTFTADGVQVDKSEIMAHCHAMVALFSRGPVGTFRVQSVFE